MLDRNRQTSRSTTSAKSRLHIATFEVQTYARVDMMSHTSLDGVSCLPQSAGDGNLLTVGTRALSTDSLSFHETGDSGPSICAAESDYGTSVMISFALDAI